MQRSIAFLLALTACSKSEDKKPAVTPPPPQAAPAIDAAVAAAPTARTAAARHPEVEALLAKGTACAANEQGLPLDCPEYKAVGELAFQNQGSEELAETCAKFLSDTDTKKRLLAAKCIESLNARTATTVLGFALDALEKEQDASVRERIAWSIKSAEVVSAKLEDRVLALVKKLAADPKTERTAGYLFWTFFPQYLASNGPKAPPAAQALAIESMALDCSGMQRTAFDSIRLLDDQAAACAAAAKAVRADAKCWGSAADAFASASCTADVETVLGVVLDRMKAGDVQPELLRKLDKRIELTADARKRVLAALKAARGKAPDWQRKGIDETIAQYSKPRVAP